MENTEVNSKRKRPIGIKWKMFAILICFVSVFAVAIWIFEIQMLSFFYQSAKHNEFKNTAENISTTLNNDDLTARACAAFADEYYNDIWVYRLDHGFFNADRPLVYVDGTKDGFGPFLEANFDLLYERTQKNSGIYIAMVPMKNFKESYFEFKIISDNLDEPRQFPFISGNMSRMSAMYFSLHKAEDTEYLIVQRANISPIGTMVDTLENQVLFVGLLLIILALLLAVIMSKLITKPIIRINDSAKSFAIGKYDIRFSGHGYREIEELSETLNFAAGELSKNDRLQKELISNISHDLRTPLTMIKGYSEVMRDIPGENTPENVQVIIDETARLSELVNDMLDLSKIQAGTRVPDMRLFCLTEAVRSTMFRYEKLMMQDGYKIDFEADRDVYVYADSGMILQVVYNLINNAINYTGADKQVTVRQTVDGETVRISISDTGDGIAEADIPYIWDRYYKVDKVHRRATVGTGLGLSIVKGILELHNASYGVVTSAERGSTFWFELKTSENEEYKAELVKL